MSVAGGRIAAGVGANLIGQHAQDRNQDATVYVGNLDAQAAPALSPHRGLRMPACGPLHWLPSPRRCACTSGTPAEDARRADDGGAGVGAVHPDGPRRCACLPRSRRCACSSTGRAPLVNSRRALNRARLGRRSQCVPAQGPRDQHAPGLRLCGVPQRGRRGLCANPLPPARPAAARGPWARLPPRGDTGCRPAREAVRAGAQAIKILNIIKVYGKPIRVNKASQDKKQQDIGANLFIGNLDSDVDEKARGRRPRSPGRRRGLAESARTRALCSSSGSRSWAAWRARALWRGPPARACARAAADAQPGPWPEPG